MWTKLSFFLCNLAEWIIVDNPAFLPTCFGVYVAWKGLQTWKNEYLGKKKIELAHEIYCEFKNIQYHIYLSRSSMFDNKDRETMLNKTQEYIQEFELGLKGNNSYLVPAVLLKHIEDIIEKWFSTRYRASMMFGIGIEKNYQDIKKIISDIRGNSRVAYYLSQRQDVDESVSKTQERDQKIRNLERIIFTPEDRLLTSGDTSDGIERQIQSVIDEVFHKNNLGKYLNLKSWHKLEK